MTDDLPYSGEVYRKLLHLLALILPAAVLLVGKPLVLYGLVPLALAALATDLLRARFEAVNRLVDIGFGWMMRRSERTPTPDRIAINGATWVLLSMSLLTLLFSTPVAVVAFSVFMLGDAAAALVGRAFGHHPWTSTGSTIEGTAAFLIAGFGTAVLLAGPGVATALFSFSWVSLAICTVAAGLLEALPLPINDNLLAPLGAALILHLMPV